MFRTGKEYDYCCKEAITLWRLRSGVVKLTYSDFERKGIYGRGTL